VKKVKNLDEALSFSEGADQFILQEYYPIEFDTRVLVVGGECVGGFDRYKPEGEDFLTTRKGGKREAAQLSENQIQAALEATRLQGLEIAGVDMFSFEDKIYILEVNSSPQFNVFEKKTGINVAQKILRYITT
jgi:ribosomal protein S6--L-glutamate ligase